MSLLSVEEFENLVQTGMDEVALQGVIDREEAELVHLLGGPLAGERTETYYPGAGYNGPVYLRRFTDALTAGDVLDGSSAIAVRLIEGGGAIERSDLSWQWGSVTVKYTPSAMDLNRVKRALIELVRDVVVPDRDREAGSARDDRDAVASRRRASLVRGLRPRPRNATLHVAPDARVTPVIP